MNEEKKKALDLVLRDIDKNIGKGIIKYGNDVGAKKQLPTGIKQIDDFLGNGFTIGNFSIIYGSQSSGKSTLALQTIANTQKEGKICCYVDLEHSLDEARARQLGVNWNELVIIDTAENAEQAMDAVIKLAKASVVDFIVIDSIQAFIPRGEMETKKGKEKSIEDDTIALLARQMGKFYKKVSTPIFKADISVLMIGQVRTQGIGTFYVRDGLSSGKATLHWSYQTIYMRRGQNSDSPILAHKELFLDPSGKLHKVTKKETVGFDGVLKMEKTKASGSVSERTEIHVPFYLNCGFSEVKIQEEIIEVITGTDEEKKKIKEILNKKLEEAKSKRTILSGQHASLIIQDDVMLTPFVKKACKILAKDDKALSELTAGVYKGNESLLIDNEDLSRGDEKLINNEKPKKRGRGRPKKIKEEK